MEEKIKFIKQYLLNNGNKEYIDLNDNEIDLVENIFRINVIPNDITPILAYYVGIYYDIKNDYSNALNYYKISLNIGNIIATHKYIEIYKKMTDYINNIINNCWNIKFSKNTEEKFFFDTDISIIYQYLRKPILDIILLQNIYNLYYKNILSDTNNEIYQSYYILYLLIHNKYITLENLLSNMNYPPILGGLLYLYRGKYNDAIRIFTDCIGKENKDVLERLYIAYKLSNNVLGYCDFVANIIKEKNIIEDKLYKANEEIIDLKLQIEYMPNIGEGYKKAKENFDILQQTISN